MTATASIHDLQASKAAGLPATAPLAPRNDTAVMPGFNSASSWDLAQRIGKAFAASDLVPKQYQGNLANCIVALEMANRMGASPLMVMQNLYIVHGNPGWSSKFLIACFNQCGRYSTMRYEFDRNAKGDATSCRAWAVEKATGEKLIGSKITLEMAKAEGWSTKTGSKWQTMPEQMLIYRAAAFMIRAYAPEISMGLRTDDELQDVVNADGVISSMSLDQLQNARDMGQAEEVMASAGPVVAMTYAQYEEKLRTTTDPAVREILLDEARTALPADQAAELAQMFKG